jgi:hypothetical protein
MAVANDVSEWIRQCSSPYSEARPVHFPHAGGSASSYYPVLSGMSGPGAESSHDTAFESTHTHTGRTFIFSGRFVPRLRQRARGRPVHSSSLDRRACPQDWNENAQNHAGTPGKDADCPITALVGESDGASRAI